MQAHAQTNARTNELHADTFTHKFHRGQGLPAKHGHKSVSMVHKGNIMKHTEGGFRDWGYELVKSDYRNVCVTERCVVGSRPNVLLFLFPLLFSRRPPPPSICPTLPKW